MYLVKLIELYKEENIREYIVNVISILSDEEYHHYYQSSDVIKVHTDFDAILIPTTKDNFILITKKKHYDNFKKEKRNLIIDSLL